jgi:hypothetical protein
VRPFPLLGCGQDCGGSGLGLILSGDSFRERIPSGRMAIHVGACLLPNGLDEVN